MEQAKIDVKTKFNEHATDYDEQRRKLIPCFDDFYSIPVSIIETKKEAPTILDIGAGTGLFSSLLLEKYPNAKLTLIDLSENMLEQAKDRLKGIEDIEYIVADYTKHEFEKTYDMIISSLSIHHLTEEEKRELYKKVFTLLNEGGIFVNADQVLGQTEFIESLYKNDWSQKIETSGLSRQQLDEAYERTKLDKMSTLADQLKWMNESGFQDVDCVYKYFNFVVLFGRKDRKAQMKKVV